MAWRSSWCDNTGLERWWRRVLCEAKSGAISVPSCYRSSLMDSSYFVPEVVTSVLRPIIFSIMLKILRYFIITYFYF